MERHLPYGITQCYLPPETRPALTSAMQASSWFPYPEGIEGWVDLDVGYIPRWFIYPHTVTPPGTNHLIASRPGVEPTGHDLAITSKGKKKVKERIALYGEIHDRATERHLPYGITQCYLPPDTGERAPP